MQGRANDAEPRRLSTAIWAPHRFENKGTCKFRARGLIRRARPVTLTSMSDAHKKNQAIFSRIRDNVSALDKDFAHGLSTLQIWASDKRAYYPASIISVSMKISLVHYIQHLIPLLRL
jgi:hypothetical protein